MASSTPTPERQGRRKPDRARSLRRSLATTFIVAALLSVVLLGVLNFFQARALLTNTVAEQLVNRQATNARAIRYGLDILGQTVIVAARSGGVIDDLLEFSAAYQSLLADGSDLLGSDESAAVDEFYGSVVDAIAATGLDAPPTSELVPGTDAGRYLQYHYIVRNPFAAEERSQMVEADLDASEYGRVHAEAHPRLAELNAQLGFGDLLLVDAMGNVVYSTGKRLDFGTNALYGPYRATGMARAVSGLAAVPVGDTLFVDFEIYLPAGGKPSLFVAAAVRDAARTIGAVLVEIPAERLNSVTALGGEKAGLGETGETYVVGRDQLMRSDSRLWLENPDEYLAELQRGGFAPELGDLITAFDSTVLLQPVETEAVVEAFDGEQFLGRTENYLGRDSVTAAGPVVSNRLDWVVVSEVEAAEADEPLLTYVRRVLVVALVLVPIVGLIALFVADRMTRPVQPVVNAAADVAGGRLETTLPDLGRNEFGDVARRLNTLTADLRDGERALAEEEREITRLLLSALPPRLVKQLRSGERRIRDLVDTVTVVALKVAGMLDGARIDPESAVELSARLSSQLEEVAAGLGVERVRSSSDQHLFAAGLDTPETAVATAAEFAIKAAEAIEEFGREAGIELTSHAGVSAGEAIAGLLAVDQLTYGVFGAPSRTALALNSVAAPGQILIDPETSGELNEEWDLEPARGLVDLRGEPVTAMVLKSGPLGSEAVPDPAESE